MDGTAQIDDGFQSLIVSEKQHQKKKGKRRIYPITFHVNKNGQIALIGFCVCNFMKYP